MVMIEKANSITALGMTLRKLELSEYTYPSFRESNESFLFGITLLNFEILYNGLGGFDL